MHADDRVRGRGTEPCGDAHGEHAEGRGLASVVGEESGGSDYEGAVEGDDGVLKGTTKRDAVTTNGSRGKNLPDGR